MSNERRRMPRQEMRWEGLMVDAEGLVIGRCMTVNVSATGAKLILPEPQLAPDFFTLMLSKNGEVRRQCEVTWRAPKSIGVRFIQPATPEDEEMSYIDDTLARISSGN